MTISLSIKDTGLFQQEQSSGYKFSSTTTTNLEYLQGPPDKGFDSFATAHTSVSLDGLEKQIHVHCFEDVASRESWREF